MRTVGEVARADVGTLRPDETVTRARAEMTRTGSDQVPVCRAGRLEGVVTRSGLEQVSDPTGTSVATYTTSAPTLSPTTPLDEALGLVRDSGLAWLPVIDGGRLVGGVGALEIEPALRTDEDAESQEAVRVDQPISYATGSPVVSPEPMVVERGTVGRTRFVALVFAGGVLVLAILLAIAIAIL